MKKLLLLSFAATLVITGCKVSKPGSVESALMKEVKKTVTVGGKDVKNPIADAPENVKEGAEHFQHHCQICHGLDGQATGVPFAAQMSPPVPDMTSKDVQDYADGQLKWIVENGIAPSGMPAWKGILTDEEMWKMVLYMRHLPPKGSLGQPDVFKEEEEEHKSMEMGGHDHGAMENKEAAPAHQHSHSEGAEHKH